MKILVDKKGDSTVGIIVNEEDFRINTLQDALSLIATIQEAADTQKAILFQDQLPVGFFDLSTGIAEEILQRYASYGFILAIVGDYTPYDSQSLQNFMKKSAQANQCFFASNVMEALDLLHAV